jgi:hypothetical protein
LKLTAYARIRTSGTRIALSLRRPQRKRGIRKEDFRRQSLTSSAYFWGEAIEHVELIRRANDRPVDMNQAREMLRKALQEHEADFRRRGLQLSGYGEHACREQLVAVVECHLLGGGQNRGCRAEDRD